jgi:hypothetical protein
MNVTTHILQLAIAMPDCFRRGDGYIILDQLAGPRACEVAWALSCSGRTADIYHVVMYSMLATYTISQDLAACVSQTVTDFFMTYPNQAPPLHGPPLLLLGLSTRFMAACSCARDGDWQACLEALGVQKPDTVCCFYDIRYMRRLTGSDRLSYSLMLEYARSPPKGPLRKRRRDWAASA